MKQSNKYLGIIFYNATIVICNLIKKEVDLKNYAKRVKSRKRGNLKYLDIVLLLVKLRESFM